MAPRQEARRRRHPRYKRGTNAGDGYLDDHGHPGDSAAAPLLPSPRPRCRLRQRPAQPARPGERVPGLNTDTAESDVKTLLLSHLITFERIFDSSSIPYGRHMSVSSPSSWHPGAY
eukprot:9495148-Pyramimonas_sp.AAC.1